MNSEIVLGTVGRYIDNFISWQFSHWYIAVPMCILEFFILTYFYYHCKSFTDP